MKLPDLPLVLCVSSHDPTGGAGIHADIESVAAQGAHALTVITAHTVQDTQDVSRVSPVPPILLSAQIAALLDDCAIGAIKVGLLGDAAQIDVILAAAQRARVPLVVDPVLRAGGGASLVASSLRPQMIERLFPAADVLTPNLAEARTLARLPAAGSRADAAGALLAAGARNVLITGGDEPGDPVINTWHVAGAPLREYRWPRVAGRFHGAGCTLAAALAANLALRKPMADALQDAQAYAHDCLRRALSIGQGRRIPGRRP